MKNGGARKDQSIGQDRGFTLVELLVVVALIALVTVLALPGVSSYFKVSLNSATRELASVIKESYNSAVMTGNVHRLVYDLKKNEYWVEVGPPTVLLDTAESAEREERRKRFRKASEKEPPSGFSIAKGVTRKKQPLPRGVQFEDIITQQSKDPIKEGTAYTHFFPHGLTERTIIHLKDQSNHQISLVISSLIGRTKLIGRYVTQEGEGEF